MYGINYYKCTVDVVVNYMKVPCSVCLSDRGIKLCGGADACNKSGDVFRSVNHSGYDHIHDSDTSVIYNVASGEIVAYSSNGGSLFSLYKSKFATNADDIKYAYRLAKSEIIQCVNVDTATVMFRLPALRDYIESDISKICKGSLVIEVAILNCNSYSGVMLGDTCLVEVLNSDMAEVINKFITKNVYKIFDGVSAEDFI